MTNLPESLQENGNVHLYLSACILWLSAVYTSKWKIAVKCRNLILLLDQVLPNIDEKHLYLHRRPTQPISKWSARQTFQSKHDYVSQNMAALLEAQFLCPRSDGTL